MVIDIDKMRIFLSVIKTRNFTTTADALGYTQSAISQSIKKLEEQLGLPLLTRNNKNIMPTSAAIELLPFMQKLASADDNLHQAVNSIKGIQTGTLRIGTFASVSNHFLPPIIRRFIAEYPLIQLELIDSFYWEIEKKLQSGELDLGFIIIPTSASVDYKVLPSERYMAVLPKNHRLAKKEIVSIKELVEEPFIVPSDNFKTEIGSYLTSNHLKVNSLFRSKDDYITVKMVNNNLGVSILPEMVLTDFYDLIEIRELDPPICRRLGIAVNSFNTCTPACNKFLEYLFDSITISI